MKSLRCLLFILVAGTLMTAPAMAAQRIVLLESFTNVGCAPCANANPTTHQFVDDYGTPLVLNVQYHMSWPSALDPFYLDDIPDNEAARAFYGVNAVPDLVTDGLNAPAPGNYAALEATVQPRILTASPLAIDVSTSVVGDQITVTAEVTAVDDVPATGLVVRIAIVEPYVSFVEPPGSNGETEFHCTMRTMLPGFGGTPLAITNGQTVPVIETGTIDLAWQDIYAVVWVQDTSTREVLQAAADLARPDYAMFYGGLTGGDIAALATTATFTTVVSNVGGEADIYDLHIEKTLPDYWQGTVCIGGTCYSPYVFDYEVPLDGQTQAEVEIDITPLLTMGSGTATMTATSRGDPSLVWAKTVMVMTAGDEVLIVDDDSGEAWEAYYTQAVGAAGKTHAVWDASAYGAPDGTQLGHYDTVIWSSGFGPPTSDGVAGLTSYLDDGGSLLLSGQLVGYYTFAGGAPAAGQVFFNEYLGATFNDYLFQRVSVEGCADDCLGDGLAFDLAGGDGADNSEYPEDITPYGAGVLAMEFSNNKGGAAVHLDTGTFKSVFLAFGFESIATAADRETVMARALDFLGSDVSGVPTDGPIRPFLATRPAARPNPFNPATEIAFEIGGTEATSLQVSVFDVRGRLVAVLHDGPTVPGSKSFAWDGRGRDGRAASSGVYLARVRLPDQGVSETFKMTLAK